MITLLVLILLAVVVGAICLILSVVYALSPIILVIICLPVIDFAVIKVIKKIKNRK